MKNENFEKNCGRPGGGGSANSDTPGRRGEGVKEMAIFAYRTL